jgi:hypothetical protein
MHQCQENWLIATPPLTNGDIGQRFGTDLQQARLALLEDPTCMHCLFRRGGGFVAIMDGWMNSSVSHGYYYYIPWSENSEPKCDDQECMGCSQIRDEGN